MAKYYLRLFLLIASVIGVVALIGSLLPRHYDFETSVTIEAPAGQVFPYLNRLSAWQQWSRQWNPAEIENLSIQYNGIESGVGAAQTWTDPRGEGKLWISESEPDRRIVFETDFANFPRMTSEIELVDTGQDPRVTEVTWKSRGSLPGGPFYGYFGSLFATHLTHDYERSLVRLKDIVEAGPPLPPEAVKVGKPVEEAVVD